MKKCEYCGENINDTINHIRSCDKYLIYRDKLISILTYDFLYDEYIVKEKSERQISKEIGFKKSRQVHKKLIEYNIPLRDRHENRLAKGYIELTKNKCLEKYGCEYHTLKDSPIRQKIWNAVEEKYGVKVVSQNKDVMEKIKKTNFEKYGFENVGQSEIIKQKVKDTCIEKYGVDNVRKNSNIINKIKQTKANNVYNYGHSSAIAERFFNELYSKIIPSDHIYFKPKTKEFSIMTKDKIFYCYDYVDTENKKCIEFNGDYWHGNPNIYESDWVNPHNGITSKEIQLNDKKKINAIKNVGYCCLIIWEKEYRKNPKKLIKKCIKFLNN